MRQAQTLRERLGNEGRLIVSALSFALAVEGHRHNDVDGESVGLATYYFSQPLREPGTQRFDLLELQQENRPDERTLINCEAAGAIKAIGFVLASRAEPRLTFPLL